MFVFMERQRDREVIKKGPWTSEEDEVLVNFVNKYGPRDWSSIRAMGLLPRTGKSWRLRWVNKLRPNLKIGCKFSSEEERVVIDLQARFGNKWATIASYLSGRTDNDVKNFWSTRQKRLARILQSSSRTTTKSQKSKGKSMAVHEISNFQEPKQITEKPSPKCHFCPSSSMGDPSQMMHLMPLPDLLTPNLLIPHQNLPLLDITVTDLNNPQLPSPKLDLPLFPHSHDTVIGPSEASFLDLGELKNVNFGSRVLELESDRTVDHEKLGTPDSFFDELPADILDYLN